MKRIVKFFRHAIRQFLTIDAEVRDGTVHVLVYIADELVKEVELNI